MNILYPLNPIRYRNTFLLLLLIVLMTNPAFVFAQQKKEPQPGRLRIKVSSTFATQLSQARMRTARVGKDPVVLSGIQSLDNVHKRFKVNQLKRVFRDAGIFEAKHRKYGLDRWYEITMDSTQSIEDALKAFGGIEHIEKVEPVFRKHLTDVGPNGLSVVQIKEPATARIGASGPNDPLFPAQWHYHNTGQTGGTPGADIDIVKGWQLETGKPHVVVAVMDGGIQYDHPDLAANMWKNLSEIPGNAIDDDNNGYVDDVFGYGFGDDVGDMAPDAHGTHVAGTIAAVNNNGIGVAGVAGGSGNGDGVRLMSCAVFGRTTSDHFAESYVYAADMGASISQNSWGYLWGYEQVVLEAIDYFIAEAGNDINGNQVGPMKGGTAIFSAGNWSMDYEAWPAYYTPVLAVAATMHDDVRAPYSNYGFWVDIAAPGGFNEIVNEQGVLSTITPSAYGYLEGTSMACPHVSGVAALLISKFGGPGYDHTALEQRLKSTTDNINHLNGYFSKQLGSGRLNAANALYLPDTLAPLPVEDLAIASVMHNALTVAWTSPIDLNDFPVESYDMRYSTTPITPENFNEATAVTGIPSSSEQGKSESFAIDGLSPNTIYYIAMKSKDNAGHISELSNILVQRTYLPPVLDVSSYVVEMSVKSGATVKLIQTVYNHGEAPLHYTFVYTQPKEKHIAIVEPESGVIAGGDSAHVEFTFRSLYLPPGFYSMNLILATNDPGNSEAIIKTNIDVFHSSGPVPDVQQSLIFEMTELHQTRRMDLNVGNAGHPAAMVIDTIIFSNDQFSTPVSFPITIVDLGHTTIPVDFTPTTTGDIRGSLEFLSYDLSYRRTSVQLFGDSFDPAGGITVRPASLSETLAPGGSSTQTLVVHNYSDQPVPIVARATADLYNTLPPTYEANAIQKQESLIQSAMAKMDKYSPKFLPGLEKELHAWPTVASIPTQQSPHFQYATDFEGFNSGTLHGQAGWYANAQWTVDQGGAASGQKHLHFSPPLTGYPYIFTPRVTTGSEATNSMKVNVKVGTVTNTGWQIIPASATTGYVVTRVVIDYQHTLSALVNDGNGSYHLEAIPVTLSDGYNEIAIELTRATNEFSIYLNGDKIFTGSGFASQIEEIAFYADNGTMDIDDVQIIDGSLESIQYVKVIPSATTISAGDSVSLAVTFDATHLKYSDYESFIHVRPAGAQATSIPVSLSITGEAKIATTGPVSATVTTGTDTTTQLSIVNSGGEAVAYSVSTIYNGEYSGWLTTQPATGALPVATAAPTTLSIDASNLPPGQYSASLVITSNAPEIQVPVTLNVTAPARIEMIDTLLAFVSDRYVDYDGLSFKNTGGSRLTYTLETSTSFRQFRHTEVTPLNGDAISPGPDGVNAIPNSALPFIGESYDDQFENFISLSNMNGQDGWAADGEDWFGMSPSDYIVYIQGKSNGSGTPSLMFSTLVDQGSENISSVSMHLNLIGSKGTTWQFIPQSPTQGQVVTRLQINPDQSMQVLVKNSNGSASFQHIQATLMSEWLYLTFEVDRLTSKFTILINNKKVYTGQGFGNQIEQMAFLSLMEKPGSSIFMESYEHYNCSSTLQMNENWYQTNEVSGAIEPGISTGMSIGYTHTDLDVGEYVDSVKLTTNDPDKPTVYVPFKITVNDPYVEPGDYSLQRGFKILTDSLFVTIHSGDTTTVFAKVRNNDNVPRVVYFPVPVQFNYEYRAYYNRYAKFEWKNISDTGIKLALGDDDSQPVQLPFSFEIGSGVSSDYFTIGSNGCLAHGIQNLASPINVPFNELHPNETYNKLAAYWDDLVVDENSGIYYTVDQDKLVVQYDNVLIYGTDARNTFQVIAYKDGMIKYQYLSMNDQFSASVALSPATSWIPLNLASNEPFVTDSLAITFQYENAPLYDEETGNTLYVIHPWLRYPAAAITVQPNTTVEIPIVLSGLTTGISEGNIHLLSYEAVEDNYPDWISQKIDGGAFLVPVRLTVLENPAPVLTALSEVTVVEGTTHDIIISATDPNDSLVSIAMTNAPPFISLKSTADMSATFTLAPQLKDAGTYKIVMTATDPHGASDTDTLHLSVVQYAVSSFSMINTETGEVLFDFTDGVTVNQADPDFATYAIRANTTPETVGSVKFKIDGHQVNIDNTNPYQLNRQLLSLTPGEHTVFAEPFTDRSGHGNRGESKQATITVIHATNVVMDFSLVNVVTGEVILNFNDAVTIDRRRSDFMNLNIRANTLPESVGSVKFKINGAQRNIDNNNPYLLKPGYLASLIAGDYTIFAEPFLGANGHGERGQGKQAMITIKEAPVRVIDFSLINVVSGEVISHFTNTITLNRNRSDLANLTIRANTGPSAVPSVKFKVNGAQRNIDNTAPYLLKQQLLPTLATGENTLLAEPFSEANGHGQRGEAREAKIILEDLPATVSFSLVNAATGQVLETFDHSISINRTRSDFANLNIRANTAPAIVGSVKFKVNGLQRNIDSNSPYLLSGQSLQNMPLGNTQLFGEPFTLSNGHGSRGQALDITITLTDGTTAARQTTFANEEGAAAKTILEVYPVPVTDVLHFKTGDYENRAFQLAIVNVMGQTVFQSQLASGALNGLTLNTSQIGLGSGVYYVHLIDATGARMIRKVVKH